MPTTIASSAMGAPSAERCSGSSSGTSTRAAWTAPESGVSAITTARWSQPRDDRERRFAASAIATAVEAIAIRTDRT
jgi:hypothetical protein